VDGEQTAEEVGEEVWVLLGEVGYAVFVGE